MRKERIGSDPQGRVHSVVVTSASVHDSEIMEDCLHGQEAVVGLVKAKSTES